MPPKRIYGEKGGRRAPKGFVASTYETLTSAENAAFVRSIAIFGAAVTFLSSSWGEILLPPYDSRSTESLCGSITDNDVM
ncbi:uncharacterized protein Triagg1_2658 [Trichoderma aggressivum f. europaeum]|uniref:TOM core complex subunit Tom6 n=1 Tax=Trichoderma aggressivum f. europaeum TaxID=173218 RepID=A0AAE1II70_9HYPO|nr:hypothetical protein Triagg1_2658 [Trichoderma aggressivum f. europaeum]